MGLLILVLLVLLLIGAMPRWEYSRQWGYRPAGLVTTILVVVLILVVLGMIPHSSFSI